MKKTNVLKGLLALAVVLLFAQCTEKKKLPLKLLLRQ